MLPVCILAGGLGTRLGSRVQHTPKPLLEVAGKPFLVHQLQLLAANCVTNAVLCVGYLGDAIVRGIGTECAGITISYRFDSPGNSGTLGAVRGALDALGDRFLVLYGDTYLRIDYRAVAAAWESSGLPALMTVLRNEGRWETSNAAFDGAQVTAYDKRFPDPDCSWIDYGLGGLEAAVVEEAAADVSDLADVYHDLAARGRLFGYAATERFYEIGSAAGLAETDRFLRATQPPGR